MPPDHEHRAPLIDSAFATLGVDPGADDATLRTAYLARVKAHPPDTDPDGFERVRDAYAQLKDRTGRAMHMLNVDPDAPLVSLLAGDDSGLRHVGPDPWLAALAEDGGR